MSTTYDIDHEAERWKEHGPILLEALRGILGGQLVGNVDTDAERFQKARAAIAAAEGEPENIPCVACGRSDLPLHTDYRCPECHERKAHINQARAFYGWPQLQ